MRRLTVMLLALALAASACTGSATVTQTGSTSNNDSAAPTTDSGNEPTPVPSTGNDEPTPVPPVEETVAPEADVTPTPAPDAPPVAVLPVEAFRTDSILGISSDGAFGYAGTSSPWNTETSCDAALSESLAVVSIVPAVGGDLTVVGAGLEQVGDVRQMLFNADGSAAVLSSCGSFDDPMLWLQRVELGPDGRIVYVGERLDVGAPDEGDPYLLGWTDDDTIEVRVIVEIDPDDADTWVVERRQISMATGQVQGSEQFDFFDDDGFSPRAELTTPEGTYRVIDDPAGGFGCEGFGVARTLELDNGSGRRMALSQPDLVFSDVTDLHVSSQGYISWTSGCEGFVSAFVGKLLDDGTIADAHLIEAFSFLAGSYAEFQHYRLSNDGFLNAIGQSFNPDDDDMNLEFLHYDLSADPHFVNTADPAPQIDEEPLFAAVENGGTWHVGDTLSPDPACGARTLYGRTPGGFVRAFPAGDELDLIVDVDLAETRRLSFPDSADYVSRTVVVQTECPGSYEGRQVWFGVETDQIVWGLGLQRADLGEVANVLSVRDVVQEGTDFVDFSIVQVELLDGNFTEIELVGLAQEG